MEVPQSAEQQRDKSRGGGTERRIDVVGEVHAGVRMEAGFDLNQVVAEYRALRATVIRLWEAECQPETAGMPRGDLVRFNEAIDQVLTEAVSRYLRNLNRYRDQFLAILAHDLRNPLGAITMATTAMARSSSLDARQAQTISRILHSAERMSRMVSDLLDLTRTHLGAGIPIEPSPIDLERLCQQIIGELEAAHHGRILRLEASGDLRGEWDRDRLAQVVSNLVGNALEHGREDAPITVKAWADGDEVVLTVHNHGPPIPERALPTLFDPLVRVGKGREAKASTGIGLGLYVVREVVGAHGGTVAASSSEREGTTFTVRLPRTRQRLAR